MIRIRSMLLYTMQMADGLDQLLAQSILASRSIRAPTEDRAKELMQHYAIEVLEPIAKRLRVIIVS